MFVPDYSVTIAEKIIPAADLSEQISTAGMEASGTGNMKFALNGAVTIGTLDGANIEIMEEVGAENIFIFGMTAEEVERMRKEGYNPQNYINNDPELSEILAMIGDGYFRPQEPDLFKPLVNRLSSWDDYFLMADFRSYLAAQEQVVKTYGDRKKWTVMSILNTANAFKFSSDRTIQQYAEEIWQVQPLPITLARESTSKRRK